ncbi:hypothetical protein DL96DRAFT_790326 [Flagelloscypha sp. PMI_526]|nr:hypothetical protein DL96DRAFT_790326 [Flagelloscypha sp. PMI_526]
MIATASGTARREFISSPQRRQDTSFIPKTDSQEQQDFDAEQAVSSAAVANQNLCLLQASVGLPCTREVRRQDTAFIPKTDSQEQKDFEAAQAASAARAAAETACAVRASAGLPCDPVRRQDTAFIPKTDSQEQKDFDAAQAASAAAAAAQTACLVKQSAGLPCTRELAPLSRRQDTAFIPKTDSQEQKDFEAAQAASSAAAAAQTACLVRASAGLPCTREISQVRRQDTAFIPKTDSQEQKDFDAAQAASAAAAAAQTACLVRASAGLPCTREVADLMVRSLIADLD